MFCLRVMAASIVLYDHLAPCGAFKKMSSVDVCCGWEQKAL
jgi:hypothetical protein